MISLKDLGQFLPPSPEHSAGNHPEGWQLNSLTMYTLGGNQGRRLGINGGGCLASFGESGIPGAGGGLQTSMVVLSGGVTFSTRWTGNRRKPNVGHLSPCDSDMSSEVLLIQSFSSELVSTCCVPGTALGPG